MIKTSIKAALSSIIIMSSLASLPSYAASACKGIAESACDNSSSCYWVSSYKRADGATVKAHCRTKAKSSISKAADKKVTQTTKKTDAKKAEAKTTDAAKKKTTSSNKKLETTKAKSSS